MYKNDIKLENSSARREQNQFISTRFIVGMWKCWGEIYLRLSVHTGIVILYPQQSYISYQRHITAPLNCWLYGRWIWLPCTSNGGGDTDDIKCKSWMLVAAVIMVIMVHAIYKSYVRQNKYLEENYPLMCSAIWWQSRRPVINAIILTSDLSRCNYQPVMGPIAAIWVGISQNNILTYQHQLMEEQSPDQRCGQR